MPPRQATPIIDAPLQLRGGPTALGVDLGAATAPARALQGLGATGRNITVDRLQEIDRQETGAFVANEFADLTTSDIQRFNEASRNAGPGAKDFTKSYMEAFDAELAERLKKAPNPRARAALQQRIALYRGDVLDRALKFEDKAATAQRRLALDDSVQKLANAALTNPAMYPKLDAQLADALALAESNFSPEEMEELRRGAVGDLAYAYANGVTQADPYAARDLLRSGELDDKLSARQKLTLVNANEVDIRQREATLRAEARQRAADLRAERAEARAQLAELKGELRLVAGDVKETIGGGGNVASSEIGQLIGRLRAVGLSREAGDLEEAAIEASYRQSYRVLDPITLSDEIRTLDQKITEDRAQDRTTPRDVVARYEAVRKVAGEQATALKQDPLAYASQAGVASVQPLELFGAAAAASMQARRGAADVVADHYGVPIRYLTDGEQSTIATAFQQSSDDEKIALVGTIRQGFGDSAVDVFREIAPKNQELAHLGDLAINGSSIDTLRDILSGDKLLKGENAEALAGPTKLERALAAESVIAEALPPELANERGAIVAAADRIYATRATRENKVGAFDQDLYREALDEAAGGVRRQGSIRGGFGTINGQSVLLPPGMAQDDLDSLLDGLTDEGWLVAGQGAGVPTDPEGRPLTSDELRDAYLEWLPDRGLYLLNLQPRTSGLRQHVRGGGPEGLYLFDVNAAQNWLRIKAEAERRTGIAEEARSRVYKPEEGIGAFQSRRPDKLYDGATVYAPPKIGEEIARNQLRPGVLYELPDGRVSLWNGSSFTDIPGRLGEGGAPGSPPIVGGRRGAPAAQGGATR